MIGTRIRSKLIEIRPDFMQLWECDHDLPPSQYHLRHIWLAPFQSKLHVKVGDKAILGFVKHGNIAEWRVVPE